MKKITAYLVAGMLLIPGVARASAEDLKVTVSGMVCSFCAQGIKKSLLKNDAILDASVDLDNHLVTVKVKEGASLTDEAVKNIIEASGYAVTNIQRSS